jgi:hypothetical protein
MHLYVGQVVPGYDRESQGCHMSSGNNATVKRKLHLVSGQVQRGGTRQKKSGNQIWELPSPFIHRRTVSF